MSVLNRKRDLLYLIFFLIHLPVLFCVDLFPLYPDSLKPQALHNLRAFYIDTYRDQFFTHPPAWFTMYLYLEAIYHVPVSFWAVRALLRNDSKVPLQLLVYAMQTGVTTATCIADFLSWSSFSNAEKVELAKLYVPYLAFSVFMGVDMYARLSAALKREQPGSSQKKKV